MKHSKQLLITGSVFMALAVCFGAFGAHIVQDMLTPDRFEVYKTAVEYQFYHAIGLLLLGCITMHIEPKKWILWSGYAFVTGILIFSGSLYILTLTDTGWLGAITPFGGFAFILGWIFLIVGILRSEKEPVKGC